MPTRPPTHRPPGAQTPKQRAAEYERYRGSSAANGYGSDWRRFRIGYLMRHPICADCERRGILTVAEEVHHIRKVRDAPELRLSESNVIGLCVSCHSTRTGRGE